MPHLIDPLMVQLPNNLTNKNVAVGINHISDVKQTIFPTGVMRGPVTGLGWTLPVVIGLQLDSALGIVQMRTIIRGRFFGKYTYLVRSNIWADSGDIFYYFTAQAASFVIHQASDSFFTSDPVVDVGLDHELVAYLFPEFKVHGTQLCLFQRYLRRYRNFPFRWPWGTWCDCITTVRKVARKNKQMKKKHMTK